MLRVSKGWKGKAWVLPRSSRRNANPMIPRVEFQRLIFRLLTSGIAYSLSHRPLVLVTGNENKSDEGVPTIPEAEVIVSF